MRLATVGFTRCVPVRKFARLGSREPLRAFTKMVKRLTNLGKPMRAVFPGVLPLVSPGPRCGFPVGREHVAGSRMLARRYDSGARLPQSSEKSLATGFDSEREFSDFPGGSWNFLAGKASRPHPIPGSCGDSGMKLALFTPRNLEASGPRVFSESKRSLSERLKEHGHVQQRHAI